MSNEQGKGRLEEALKWAEQLRKAQRVGDVGELAQALANEVERLREEHDRLYKHGVTWNTGVTVYGTEAACKELGAQLEWLRRYQQQESRTASALERIAAALEERLPPIEDANKIEALQSKVDALSAELVNKAAEIGRLCAAQPDLGVACCDCGKPMRGFTNVAGKIRCTDCFTKAQPYPGAVWQIQTGKWSPPDAPGDG